MSKKVSREVVNDIAAGTSNAEVCEKHGLDNAQVETIRKKLKVAGVIKANSAPTSSAGATQITTQSLWKCPACNTPQTKAYDECPQCGILVSKYLNSTRIQLLKGDHLIVGDRIKDKQVQGYIDANVLVNGSYIVASGMYGSSQNENFYIVLTDGPESPNKTLTMLKKDWNQLVGAVYPLKEISNIIVATSQPVGVKLGVLEFVHGAEKINSYFDVSLAPQMEKLKDAAKTVQLSIIDIYDTLDDSNNGNDIENVKPQSTAKVKSVKSDHTMSIGEIFSVVVFLGFLIVGGWWFWGWLTSGPSPDITNFQDPRLEWERNRAFDNISSQFIGMTYSNELYAIFSEKWGTPITLPQTNNNYWYAYFPDANITMLVDKKSQRISDFWIGRVE